MSSICSAHQHYEPNCRLCNTNISFEITEDQAKAFDKHQANPYVHPLTCGNNSNHNVLKLASENGKRYLYCPDCEYKQGWVPFLNDRPYP